MSKGNPQLIAQAKAAEGRGEVDEAARLWAAAGSVEDAARVFMTAGQFGKAGRVLFRAVGLSMERMADATPEQRKLAVRAGICLAKAGEAHNAAAVFVAAGDPKRAIETLERAGDTVGAAKLRAQVEGHPEARVAHSSGQVSAARYATGLKLEQQGDLAGALAAYIQAKAFSDAGRLAHKLGRTAEAGEFFEEGGLFYEAAVCWSEQKDTRRCLDNLVRVSRDHPRYRGCCVKAIEIGYQLGEIGFELDQFVARFVSSGPETQQEIDALMMLAKLYERGDFLENARECYRKVLAAVPGHPAAKMLAELDNAARASSMVYEKIIREDGAFHGDVPRASRAGGPERRQLNGFPDLPDLPPLPGAAKDVALARTQVGIAPRPPAPAAASQAAAPAPAAAAPISMSPGNYGGFGATMMRPAEAPAPAMPAQAVQPGPPAAAAPPQAPAPTPQGTQPLELVPGSVIADRYRLEKQIGQGGTAVVFRATDMELEEEVAIKIFTVVVDDPDMIRRFKQELSLTRQLSHPNIVRLHDIGAHRGFRFLTMEILQGTDLSSLLEKGMLPLADAIDLLVQACSGLQLAHERGIVHRDIKPENFFVTTQKVLKVMDFGIAKKTQSQKLTQAGFIAGTPPYMSPEQISGFTSVTHLADIYSLGIVAYEMFTGSLPFMHDEMMPLLLMHMTEQPQPPIARNPKLPKALNALILRLLEKEPGKRVQSMKEFAEELSRIFAQLTA